MLVLNSKAIREMLILMKTNLIKYSLLMIMLLMITTTVSGQGLPQLTVELPDPGEVLGKNGRVYDERYVYEERIYKTFLYDRPENEEKFLKDYSEKVSSAGYKTVRDTVEGAKALRISSPLLNSEMDALLLYDFQGYVFLMVPENMKFTLLDIDSIIASITYVDIEFEFAFAVHSIDDSEYIRHVGPDASSDTLGNNEYYAIYVTIWNNGEMPFIYTECTVMIDNELVGIWPGKTINGGSAASYYLSYKVTQNIPAGEHTYILELDGKQVYSLVFEMPFNGDDSGKDSNLLESMVPEELLHYIIYDWVQYLTDLDQPENSYKKEVTSSVKTSKILRRQTEEKSDYVECEFVLSDFYLDRAITLSMNLNYYDQGGWCLDNWKLLSSSVQTINKSYDINNLKKYLSHEGYIPERDIYVDEQDSSLHYIGELSSSLSPYLSVSGQVDAVVSLQEEGYGYSWNVQYEPKIETKWNIQGEWYGEPHPFSYSYGDGLQIWPNFHYLYVNIKDMDLTSISGTIEDKWNKSDGNGIGTYKEQENKKIIYSIEKVGQQTQDIRLLVMFDAGYNCFDLAFGPDSAYIRFHYFSNMPNDSFGNEWAKLTKR